MSDTKTRALPSALPPTKAEAEEWNALTREEQIARFRETLAHPDCDTVVDDTMEEILAQARARLAAQHG